MTEGTRRRHNLWTTTGEAASLFLTVLFKNRSAALVNKESDRVQVLNEWIEVFTKSLRGESAVTEIQALPEITLD